jgi:hypothetical protein
MENTTLTYSCDDCDDDYGCKMCNISYWPYFQFDSLNMPDLDIAIKTIGTNIFSLILQLQFTKYLQKKAQTFFKTPNCLQSRLKSNGGPGQNLNEGQI